MGSTFSWASNNLKPWPIFCDIVSVVSLLYLLFVMTQERIGTEARAATDLRPDQHMFRWSTSWLSALIHIFWAKERRDVFERKGKQTREDKSNIELQIGVKIKAERMPEESCYRIGISGGKKLNFFFEVMGWVLDRNMKRCITFTAKELILVILSFFVTWVAYFQHMYVYS